MYSDTEFNDAAVCRPQSLGEEIANSVSHGVGTMASLVAYPVLVVVANQRGGIGEVVAVSAFAITLVLLYTCSTVFHALPEGRAKRTFQVLDHAAIYLLIAGTYTPFTVGVLHGALGWSLFGLIWGLALTGCLLKAFRGVGGTGLSTFLYIAMGWLVLIAFDSIWTLIPGWGIFWLFAGGIAYTVGALFFLLSDRVRYCHFIWHLFVLTGSTCHFIAVLFYSA